jgi:iron complex outermembrane receptor protein
MPLGRQTRKERPQIATAIGRTSQFPINCVHIPCIAAAMGAMVPALADAQTASATPPQPPTANEQITVIAPSPLPGSGIDRDQVPEATQVLSAKDINRTGVPSLTDAMLEDIPSVYVNETSGNIFQPDILFRGFTASPVAGTGQGLAVYVNGARFNDPFGETVNWDLVPSIAIDSVNVEASNPIFGLNALGGSVNVQLKNGFTYQGADITGYGGSYNRGAGIMEYGHQSGNFSAYFAGEVTNDAGFRQTQQSDIYRLYTDFGWRNDTAELHLGIDAAHNTIGNPGAAPVQAVDDQPTAIFTAPNDVYNKYVALNLNGKYTLSDTTSLQALAYYQTLTQRIDNGTTVSVKPCDDGSGNLCNDDGTPVTGRGGVIVKNFLNGGPYSGLVLEGLDAHSYGGSTQITNNATLAGMKNRFVAGASFDGSDSDFEGTSELGGYNPTSTFFNPPGVTQDQASEGVEPVHVVTTTRYYGLFVSNVLTLLPDLDLTLNGRFNNAEIDLHDKTGAALDGQHSYSRFNPNAGLTYRISPALQLYAGYAEANRAPTPTELSCASAANPCSLLNFFIGDPNLKQVVARTFEGGLRGNVAEIKGGKLTWDVDYYHTTDQDDLIFETTAYNPNLAYYTNVGRTLRQGAEATLHFDTRHLHAVVGYALTDATFQSPLLLGSDSNPSSDANGNEHVAPGDHIPGIPMHRGNIVLDYKITDRWSLGLSSTLTSSQYRFGDEANLTKPVGGVILLNLNTSYRITDAITVFALANNVTDQHYATYGSFGPVGAVPWPASLYPGGVTDPRTESAGAPVEGYGGLRVTF